MFCLIEYRQYCHHRVVDRGVCGILGVSAKVWEDGGREDEVKEGRKKGGDARVWFLINMIEGRDWDENEDKRIQGSRSCLGQTKQWRNVWLGRLGP